MKEIWLHALECQTASRFIPYEIRHEIELMISVKHFEHFMLLHSSIFEAQNVVTDLHTWGRQFCCENLHCLLEWGSVQVDLFSHIYAFHHSLVRCMGLHSNDCTHAHSIAGASVQLSAWAQRLCPAKMCPEVSAL